MNSSSKLLYHRLKCSSRLLTYRRIQNIIAALLLAITLICLYKLKKDTNAMTFEQDELLSFINQHVDRCLQHDSRDDQNRCFQQCQTTLPLQPLRMTLSTAVFRLGTDRVIKRVIEKPGSGLDEAAISMALRDEHVIATHEAFRRRHVDADGQVQSVVWLVMEHLDGKVTQRAIGRDEAKIRHVLKGTLQGLAYMHSQGIAHLDLKIGNVMTKSARQVVKLIDFGFSRRIAGAELYIPGKAYGTYPYKPPEVVFENIHGFSSDIWCVGAIAWFLSLGKTPFYAEDGSKDIAAYKRFLRGRTPLRFRAETSYELEDFVVQCMNRDREQRPSAKELLSHPFILGKQMERDYSETSGYYSETDDDDY